MFALRPPDKNADNPAYSPGYLNSPTYALLVAPDPERLWVAGKEISLENRQTRLYEKYRARPPRT